MRKLETGGSEHSFGIHVARMAGMPGSVVKRAGEIMKKLEKNHESELTFNRGEENDSTLEQEGSKNYQLSFFQLNDPVLENIKEELLKTEINALTPVEALFKLNEIKKMVSGN